MIPRSLARGFPLLTAVALLPACGGDENADTVLSAVVEITETTLQTIDSDETWLTDATAGQNISGTLSNNIGGTLLAGGWRATTENEDPGGLHITTGERLVMEVSQWEAAGLLVSGAISVTRHSLDYGPEGGDIEDASRTTRYLAQLSVEGEKGGTYTVDVHAFASGATLWTCGLVNDTEVEFGACY